MNADTALFFCVYAVGFFVGFVVGYIYAAKYAKRRGDK